jgi:hypothetical protein
MSYLTGAIVPLDVKPDLRFAMTDCVPGDLISVMTHDVWSDPPNNESERMGGRLTSELEARSTSALVIFIVPPVYGGKSRCGHIGVLTPHHGICYVWNQASSVRRIS